MKEQPAQISWRLGFEVIVLVIRPLGGLRRKDLRGLTPLVDGHVDPCGRFDLDLPRRIGFERKQMAQRGIGGNSMPVSKKPRKKTVKPGKSNNGNALPPPPDRRAMEGFMARLSGRRLDGSDPVEAAQHIMYEAWEAATRTKRIALARKALEVSPLCTDAYVLLAEEEAKSVEEALAWYQKGVEAGEQALGPEGFEEYAGHFWGFLETRPYMRARAGLAAALWRLGRHQEAIDHYCAMLELNPNDNQGIRYALAGHLLARNDIKALKKLINQYQEDGAAAWLYTRALLAFRENGRDAGQLAEDAWLANRHVPDILSGRQPLVASTDGYVTMGGEDEAAEYVEGNGGAWQATPGAVEWLVQATRKLKPRKLRDGAGA